MSFTGQVATVVLAGATRGDEYELSVIFETVGSGTFTRTLFIDVVA